MIVELNAYKMDEGKESQKNIYKILSSEKNKEFNPKIVELFFERFEPYAIGDSVELNDGKKAEVIVLRSEAKFLPIVEYYDEQLNSKRVVDLSQEENLEIKKIEEYI